MLRKLYSNLTYSALLTLLAIAMPALAKSISEPPIEKTLSQLQAQAPATALWWERGRNGNFWSIDVGPGGFAFVQFATYDEARQPIFLTLQGQLETPSAEQVERGATVRLRSAIYELQGGRCLGCDYTPASVSQSRFGNAELVFSSPSKGEFIWAGTTTAIERFPLYNRAIDGLASRLPGTYMVSWLAPDGQRYVTKMLLETPNGPRSGAGPMLDGVIISPALSTHVYPQLDGFREFYSRLYSIEFGVDPNSDQLQAWIRRTDDFSGCGRVCACPEGYGKISPFISICAPLNFNERERFALTASGEREGELVLSAAGIANSLTVGFGTLSLRRLDDELSRLTVQRRSLQPSRGLWWETAKNGQFWSIDVGAGGYMFVNFGTFDADGQPTFLTMQGQFEPYAEGTANGATGKLVSTLYRLQGGQCLGCEFQAASVNASQFGVAEIEFFGSQSAVFSWREQQIQINKFPLYLRPADLPSERLQGSYSLQVATSAGRNRSAITLETVVGSCPQTEGTTVLGVRCISSSPCSDPSSPPTGIFADLYANLEIHVAPAAHSQLIAYRLDQSGCSIFGRLNEREGRLDLSPVGGSGTYYTFLPFPPAESD